MRSQRWRLAISGRGRTAHDPCVCIHIFTKPALIPHISHHLLPLWGWMRPVWGCCSRALPGGKWNKMVDRLTDIDSLWGFFAGTIQKFPYEEFNTRMNRAGGFCCKVNTLKEGITQQQVVHSGSVTTSKHPQFGAIQVASPFAKWA